MFSSLGEAQCRLPKGPVQLGAPRVNASRGTKWKTEGACESSPKLQALGGGSAKCSKGVILAQLYWNI